MDWRRCAHRDCGLDFPARSRFARFCSDICRVKEHYRVKRDQGLRKLPNGVWVERGERKAG